MALYVIINYDEIPVCHFITFLLFINTFLSCTVGMAKSIATGWISGDWGLMLKTTNAGYTWIQQNTGYDDHYVNSVFFTDEDKGWAAANSLVLKTDDGGDHWTKIYTDQSIWQSVYFPDEFIGYVAGTYGMIAKTTDGGDSWTTQESNTDVYLNEVFFSGYDAGWIVGKGGKILHFDYLSENWESQSTGEHFFIWELDFTDELNGWVVGDDDGILHTQDGGLSWHTINFNTNTDFVDVCFPDSLTGWILGTEGLLLKTVDGGLSWETQIENDTIYPNYYFDVCFVDRFHGWITANYGELFHTVDGGLTWFPQNTNTGLPLYSVHFIDTLKGWVCGHHNIIMHTADGGYHWEIQQAQYYTTHYRSIFFHDSLHGWACGEHVNFRTTDGGLTWIPNDDFGGLDVSFADELNGWIVGWAGGIHRTTDGGITWERQESGTGGIQFLTSIDCINPDIAWIGGDYGKILHTDNGGIVSIQDDKQKIIQEITVNQFPNPFSTSTVLEYTLKQSTHITIHIFNSYGQPVEVISFMKQDKGTHRIQWNAEGFSAGIYFYNLRAGNVNSSGKMVLVR